MKDLPVCTPSFPKFDVSNGCELGTLSCRSRDVSAALTSIALPQLMLKFRLDLPCKSVRVPEGWAFLSWRSTTPKKRNVSLEKGNLMKTTSPSSNVWEKLGCYRLFATMSARCFLIFPLGGVVDLWGRVPQRGWMSRHLLPSWVNILHREQV